MEKIQVDMFAVKLGLSVLLQFKSEGKTVSVLADAGSKKYKVNKKLKGAIEARTDGKLRIDLMIGTHYDSDHLNGLVDIINNPDIEIGEAWMPPVANDTRPYFPPSELQNEAMLGIQFAGKDGDQILDEYLRYKLQTCLSAREFEHKYDESKEIVKLSDISETVLKSDIPPKGSEDESDGDESGDDEWDRLFQAHLEDAYRTLGMEKVGHADLDIRIPDEFDEEIEMIFWLGRFIFIKRNGQLDADRLRGIFPDRTGKNNGAVSKLFAHMRVSAAKDGINANSLAKVVEALEKRKIKTCYKMIEDGEPSKFLWDAGGRRFTLVQKSEAVQKSKANKPSFTLLGPSRGLVKKHWHKLPIGTYSAYLTYLQVKEITPSNELSYIGVFECHNQRILISGDAGCVDFIIPPAKARKFYPKLIKQLEKLDIVQVAHHGGHNAYFYHSLRESGFVCQSSLAYLLLSHGTYDKHRPSDIFSEFIKELEKGKGKVQLLFTSKPLKSKVHGIKHLIADRVGPTQGKGDVRLSFDCDKWYVKSHHVKVH